MSQLADSLGIQHFGVLGISGGGPYALACAERLRERIVSTVVVSGMGPPDSPGIAEGACWALPGKGRLSRWLTLLQTASGLRSDPASFVVRSGEWLSEKDRTLLEKPALAEAFAGMIREAFRPGTSGVSHDAGLYRCNWGFRLCDVPGKVHLWHGELDRNVPVSVGRFVAGAIRDCESVFLPDEAHISLPYYHIRQILEPFVRSVQKAEDTE